MMNEKKRYKVTIFGEDYTLVSSEREEQVQESAHLVNKAMQEITSKSTVVIEPHKVAVLAALRIATSLVQAQSSACAHAQRQELLIASIDELFSTVLNG